MAVRGAPPDPTCGPTQRRAPPLPPQSVAVKGTPGPAAAVSFHMGVVCLGKVKAPVEDRRAEAL